MMAGRAWPLSHTMRAAGGALPRGSALGSATAAAYRTVTRLAEDAAGHHAFRRRTYGPAGSAQSCLPLRVFAGDFPDQRGRVIRAQGNGTQPGKYLPVPLQFARVFQVDVPDKSFDIDDVAYHGLFELDDHKGAVHRWM